MRLQQLSLAACAVAALSALLPVSAEAETVLRVVKHSPVRVLDPIMTTAYTARDHGYMIFDTLLALDEKQQIKPQMLEGWKISDDGLTYSFTLRDGLKWHDGTPVTAEDCIASIKRWGQRDGMGQKLMDFTKEMKPTGDKSFDLVLKEPYGLVLESLAKPSSSAPFMVPKKLAETPPSEPMPEQIGSGPFKWVASEFQPGLKVVYVKNTDYVPRSEAPSWASGGKVVKVDRVEQIAMPDHMTTVNALLNAEIDYMENPPTDLIPLIEADSGVEIKIINKLGSQVMLRPNHLHPPFNNPKVRQALAYAVNQEDLMIGMMGDPRYYKLCTSMFICETPFGTTAGSEGMGKGDIATAAKLLKESGYDGTKVVIMHPTDVATLSSHPPIVAQAMRKAGFNVELLAMDWQTLVSRRAKQDPVDQGGWNLFATTWVGADLINPVANLGINGRGKKGGWFGWYESAEMEGLRDSFARATDPARQKALAEQISKLAWQDVANIPLGQYFAVSAYRKNVTGVLEGPVPFFWNIEKKG
ncbi:MAG: ABC transporter substrate-binding protein [Alphaproteobacteria bacterium]|nr:ABC transporter substrate-binding protein [Alphaproteobacteria bacterium]MBU0798979.1 ABC transporter substrate-binding protein [Alphaproteobacteria bacterium]MBU0887752.1 ABC transporter substrate-binding protein [Alphaproteobacteria bacterium]MBU1815025.1 ABC transporter substrate-binding protein [Alphaproteobacteria bacterium]MBU2090738.1 ABC transporter substrate-binding protein [Alphaproteobacteria bacterium]